MIMQKNIVRLGCLSILALSLVIPRQDARAADAPEDMVRQAMAAVTANRPDQLFDLLPPSYQRDIDDVVKAFAGKMDAGTWNQARRLVAKLARILTKQQDLMVTVFAQQLPPTDDPEALKGAINGLATLAGHLSGSKLSDLNRLKEGNVKELLATEGQSLMKALESVSKATPDSGAMGNLWTNMRESRVEQAELDGDTAMVRIISDEETEEVRLVRVEERWIPADMADGWRETMDGARESIAAMNPDGPEGQQQKVKATMMMGVLDGLLTQIENAKTQEEVEAVFGGLMMMLMGGMGMQP